MSSVRSFVLVVALAAFVSACDSSDSNPSPNAPTPAPAPAPAPAPTPGPTPTNTTVTIGPGADVAGASAYGVNPLTIATGTTVIWRNDDVTDHTATSDTAGVFDTGRIGTNATSNGVTFNTAGTVRYHCTIHPGMVGTIVVQ